MITCVVHYVVDPAKIADFERFGRAWMELVERHGGRHHGYFLPSEGGCVLRYERTFIRPLLPG